MQYAQFKRVQPRELESIPFDGDKEVSPCFAHWIIEVAVVFIILWLAFKATGVDLYSALKIMWGV